MATLETEFAKVKLPCENSSMLIFIMISSGRANQCPLQFALSAACQNPKPNGAQAGPEEPMEEDEEQEKIRQADALPRVNIRYGPSCKVLNVSNVLLQFSIDP